MGMKKYEHFHMTAWKRYGELKAKQTESLPIDKGNDS
jgi:hypothetical protein